MNHKWTTNKPQMNHEWTMNEPWMNLPWTINEPSMILDWTVVEFWILLFCQQTSKMLKFRPLACFYGPHGSWRNSHFSIFFRCFWHFQFLGPKISKCDCEKIVLSETRICSRVKIIPLKAKIKGKNKNKIQISKKNWNLFLKIFAFFKFFSF